MLKIKNESGVTLVALTTTIIVVIILASISLTLGLSSVDESKDDNNEASLNIVQQAVITQYTKAFETSQLNIPIQTGYANKPKPFIGTLIENINTVSKSGFDWVVTSFNSYEDYYYRLSIEDLETIGVGNSECVYIVNYKTGEVYNETKKTTSTGESLYITSLKDLPTSDSVDATFNDD